MKNKADFFFFFTSKRTITPEIRAREHETKVTSDIVAASQATGKKLLENCRWFCVKNKNTSLLFYRRLVTEPQEFSSLMPLLLWKPRLWKCFLFTNCASLSPKAEAYGDVSHCRESMYERISVHLVRDWVFYLLFINGGWANAYAVFIPFYLLSSCPFSTLKRCQNLMSHKCFCLFIFLLRNTL